MSAYNSTRQTLSRQLIGDSAKESEDEATFSRNVSFHDVRVLLKKSSLGYLRQLIIREGSMELEDLVLDCLDRFFKKWEPSLPPAQRIHIKHSDAKWIAAAFWLCAMARSMTVGKDEEADDGKGKTPKKIGGRKGKELKDNILDTVEHKVTKAELEKTIRLVEQEISDYLLSLRVSKGKLRASGTTTPSTSAPSTPRKRKTSNESSIFVEIDIPVRGGGQAQPAKVPQWREPAAKENEDESSSIARKRPHPDVYTTMSTKRQVSNVSLVSDTEGDQASSSNTKHELSTRSTRPPPTKRTKVDAPPQLSSADIMRPKKNTGPKSLKETATIPDSVIRRKTGVYSMVRNRNYKKKILRHRKKRHFLTLHFFAFLISRFRGSAIKRQRRTSITKSGRKIFLEPSLKNKNDLTDENLIQCEIFNFLVFFYLLCIFFYNALYSCVDS